MRIEFGIKTIQIDWRRNAHEIQGSVDFRHSVHSDLRGCANRCPGSATIHAEHVSPNRDPEPDPQYRAGNSGPYSGHGNTRVGKPRPARRRDPGDHPDDSDSGNDAELEHHSRDYAGQSDPGKYAGKPDARNDSCESAAGQHQHAGQRIHDSAKRHSSYHAGKHQPWDNHASTDVTVARLGSMAGPLRRASFFANVAD